MTPGLHDTLNDSFLASSASSASTQNLVFTGLAPTLAPVQEHGLQHKVSVKHIAKEGVLHAQYTAYFAWLYGVSLVALTVALANSAVIGALITERRKARRDFPLRLAGRRWNEILAGRVLTEWVPGLALVVLILFWHRGEHGLLVVRAASLTAGLAP